LAGSAQQRRQALERQGRRGSPISEPRAGAAGGRRQRRWVFARGRTRQGVWISRNAREGAANRRSVDDRACCYGRHESSIASAYHRQEDLRMGTSSAKLRVLLADDHRLVRLGFRRLLDDEDDMEVVAEAANGAEAITLAE